MAFFFYSLLKKLDAVKISFLLEVCSIVAKNPKPVWSQGILGVNRLIDFEVIIYDHQ
jgi:hypothetical protein